MSVRRGKIATIVLAGRNIKIVLNLGREINNDLLMATIFCHLQQILAGQCRGCGVGQRMTIDFVMLQQALINGKGQPARMVIDDAESGHGPGSNAKQFFHLFRTAKGKAAGSAK